VLIVGGTGHFGRLLVDDLRRYVNCELVVADRHSANLWNPESLDSALSGVSVAICAAGPFQTLPTTLAELCLQRGIHYIDFADDRAFVRKIHALVSRDAESLAAICPAWSTVSALSGLLTQIACRGLDPIEAIYIHMAPGNRGPRSAGTIASLLHSVGRPFTVFRDGGWRTVCGWSEGRDFVFPSPIGSRCGYLVDVPDHEFFPELFHARTVEFRTASELRAFNSAVSALGWFVKSGVVHNWAPWSRAFEHAAALLGFMGHDWGGVGVEVVGSKGRRRVSVVADSGGQRIAVMPASVMTLSLLSGSKERGLVSPAHWLTSERLYEECEKRGFRLIMEEL
jgi:saccharopine dehydrogenase-like NADP-dependent oxidoreductase